MQHAKCHVDMSSLISDTHAGVTVPKRSRRGQRATSPVAASSPSSDLEESAVGNSPYSDQPAFPKGNAYECAHLSGSSSLSPIEIHDFDPDPVCDWWIQALGLYQDDKTALLSQGELTENIINAVHTLLSLQFPHIAGLQDTLLGHHLDYVPISSDVNCVQILHTG